MAGERPTLALAAFAALWCVGCQGPAPQEPSLAAPPVSDAYEQARRAQEDGLELLAQGFVTEALSRFQKALAHDPLRYEVHLDLGLCYYQLGQYSLEIAEYQKCLAINPQAPRAWKNLGHACLSADMLPEAKTAYERYLALVPHDGPVLYNLGLVAMDLGLNDEARELFQRSKSVGVRNAHDKLRELQWR